MAQVIIANAKTPTPSTDGFFGWWQLTRALIAAGWKYKASGDATATGVKDTSGSFINDKWGVQGAVALAVATVQSGTGPNITANTDGTATVTFAGTSFTANSVGRFLTIAGTTNANNSGTWRIVTFTSATSIKIFNPGAVTENTATATWAEKQGGSNGTISSAGSGGATPGRAIFTVSSGTPFVSPTTSPVNRGSVGDRITIANGAVGANNGTFMITRVISSTSVEIDNSAATSVGETNNGSLVWTECSPTAQTYPASLNSTGVGAWINLQGPSTLKIAIGTNVPSAAFFRGELVTQTGSGATGTILGVITDTTGGTGFLVIEPRLNGTGTGVRGWTSGSADTVSAQVAPAGSGASVASSTTAPIEFVREMVIWRASNSAGHVWAQTVDQSAESASRFSVLAGSAGVTNTVAPGGPAATFPTPGSYALFGTGNAGTATTTPANWFNTNVTSNWGASHVMCASCIENASEAADGSWTLLTGLPTANSQDGYITTAFQHLDSTEDGDLDPYVHLVLSGQSIPYSATRTALTSSFNVGTSQAFLMAFIIASSATNARGWRRRGFSTGDQYQDFQLGWLMGNGIGSGPLNVNTAYPCRIANHPNPTTTQIREAVWVYAAGTASGPTGSKMRKGYMRWWYWTEGGVTNNLLFNGTFIQLGQGIAPSAGGPAIAGPWDGVSIPHNNN